MILCRTNCFDFDFSSGSSGENGLKHWLVDTNLRRRNVFGAAALIVHFNRSAIDDVHLQVLICHFFSLSVCSLPAGSR